MIVLRMDDSQPQPPRRTLGVGAKIGIAAAAVFAFILLAAVFAPDPDQQRYDECISRGYIPAGTPIAATDLKTYCQMARDIRHIQAGMDEQQRQADADLKP